ncbi:MAG: anhydro-N-acetylmuramic acid kinase [Bergeyella sp.]
MDFYAVGLMSGTSLDGLDICYTRFSEDSGKWNFEILKAETFPYPKAWEQKLRDVFYLSSQELAELHSEYGFYLGEQVRTFMQKNSIGKADLIASHGHTVFHQPQKKYTVQIGDGRAVKIVAGIPVVYDFRSQDVLMGGNGAPLVPIGDELLFSEFDACLNLGGFSNISFRKDGKRIAFDICPVNIVLNEFALKLGKKYDENGELARNGRVDEALLYQLNQLEFYRQQPPKSLGTEWLNEFVTPLLKGKEPETVLATFTQHIAEKLAETLNLNNLKNLLVTGGGAYNCYLIELLKERTATEIIIPSKDIIEFKEALVFAFMGVLKMRGENNVLSSATGCSEDHSSGIVVM